MSAMLKPVPRKPRSWSPVAFALGLMLAILGAAPPAQAQLRSHLLKFRPPADARVVGFHVYVSGNAMSYADWRDDVNFIPPVDSSGSAAYTLTGLEAFDDVYISMKSYDGTGAESTFSNEIVLAAQPQCLTSGCSDGNPCTRDTCGASGCTFDPAPQLGATCDDGISTTFDDVCGASGVCAGTPGQCSVNTDCPASANVCAGAPVCSSHTCVAGPVRAVGTTCSDGNASTFDDACNASGVCAGTLGQCSVNADCPASANVCAGAPVCSGHTCVAGPVSADGTTCSDGNTATRFDICEAGTCRGYACGSDAQCGDAESCNGLEACVNRVCVAGTPLVCGDGNVCNGTETCSASACVAGTALQCPAEAGPCFDAFCDPAQGCRVQIHPDGSACTTASSSLAGQCTSGVCVAAAPPAAPGDDPVAEEPPPPLNCDTAYGTATAVRQELTPDPETSRRIVWSAPLHPMGSQVEYRLDYVGAWTSLRGSPTSSSGCNAVWSATITGLRPRYRYVYRVTGASAKGRVPSGQFTLQAGPTAPRDRFRFAFLASNGLAGSPQSPQAVNVLSKIRYGGYPLVLGGGGYALSNEAIAAGVAPDAAGAVARWKRQVGGVAANAIFVPVLGDTEVESFSHGERPADYAEFLAGARDGAAPNGSYAFDFNTTHFVALHAPNLGAVHPATTEGAANLAWLESDLAAARAAGARWIVVYMHVDLFSSERSDAATTSVRQALGPILQRNRVNLVLSGDGDSYERSRGLRGDLANPIPGALASLVTTARDGIVFVRAGSGGRTAFGSWLAAQPPAWSAFRDNTRAVFLHVTADGYALSISALALDASGTKQSVIDRVDIR